MPTRAGRGYLVRPSGQALIAFVPHPEVAGWWFRTHPAAMVATCTAPGCGSRAGEPCKFAEGFTAATHQSRRIAAGTQLRQIEGAFGVVFDLKLRLTRGR